MALAQNRGVARQDGTVAPHDDVPARKRPLAVSVGLMSLRRCALGAATLWVVTLVIFYATQGLPGDTAAAILGQNATTGQLHDLRAQLGLTRSLPEQYLSWLGGLLRGDLGTSLASHEPVSQLLGSRISATLLEAGAAGVITVVIALLLGVTAALHRDSVLDKVTGGLSSVAAAVPPFVVGVLLIFAFALNGVHLLPAVSAIDPGESVLNQLNKFVLPCVTLVIGGVPYVLYMVRASMIEALESEYVVAAQLNGIPRRTILWRHALPNALAPTVQTMGLTVAYLVGGAVSVEVVFGLPGLGTALVSAVQYRDLPVIQVVVLLSALAYIAASIVADIVTVLITPRVRTAL